MSGWVTYAVSACSAAASSPRSSSASTSVAQSHSVSAPVAARRPASVVRTDRAIVSDDSRGSTSPWWEKTTRSRVARRRQLAALTPCQRASRSSANTDQYAVIAFMSHVGVPEST